MGRVWLAAATALALSACGDRQEQASAGDVGGQAAASAGPSQPVAASGVRRMADCAGVKGRMAPAGQPTDDVLGVRMGMPLAEARKVIACANPVYVFAEHEGQWRRDGKPPIRRLTLHADGGLDDVVVDFAGSKGSERAVRLVRSMEYAQGKEQTIELIRGAVQKKYGELDALQGYGHAGAAVYSLDGQRLGNDNSDYSQCVYAAGDGPTSAVTLMNCGLVVRYGIQPSSSDPALARAFNVVVFDGGMALRTLDDLEAASRSEAEKAAETGEGPKI